MDATDVSAEELSNCVSVLSKSDKILREVLSKVDEATRVRIHEILTNPSSSSVVSMSPSRWDCPVTQTQIFKKKTNNKRQPSSPNSPSSKQIVNIIIPSLTVDIEELKKVEGIVHYEERQLYNLLSLKDPNVHVIYITALPLHPSIVNYYLSFLDDNPSDRLTLFSVFDASNTKTLTEKILERPRLHAKIRRTVEKIGINSITNMLCFIPTDHEHKLAELLNAKLEASPKNVQFWGSKCGSRQIFKECDISLPRGTYESIWEEDELAKQILSLWDEIPDVSRIIVKLNEGFSGEGNAMLVMEPIRERTKDSNENSFKIREIKAELPKLRFQGPKETWKLFMKKISILGCIIEEYIEGEDKKSPSLQGMIHPDGSTEIISTHEQILGGTDGQVYLGCHFPCEVGYRLTLHEYGKRVAKSLAKKGARGRFGVDFIVVPLEFDEFKIFALEINLRQGGTTHPYETLHLLTGGDYSATTGLYLSDRGEEKYYVASDNLRKDSYRGLLPSDLMMIIGKHDLLFDEETHSGAVFHLMGALSQFGKVGVTCIGNSLDEAQAMYETIVKVLDDETVDASL